MPLFALCMLRYMSATSNIVHDCDEVFKYWEPLHYLLYKSGFQTWEYSDRNAKSSGIASSATRFLLLLLLLLFLQIIVPPRRESSGGAVACMGSRRPGTGLNGLTLRWRGVAEACDAQPTHCLGHFA
ncbi:hypothetical protein Dsin_019160 [Dipteronia sinensis]|uniref:Mannosyltransferase n=1 Tax=Dipteronia sinensis TaxID=43782 RepID=A0AAE0A7J0_9ROSI|nr:hypothetical protein Dsin_019160 [Dipteronia sinensis]